MIQTPISPDQQLVLAYVSARDRDALSALFRIDAHLGSIVLNTREPMVARIKLAWWRETGFAMARPVSDLDADIRQLEVRVRDCHALLAQLADGWGEYLESGEDDSWIKASAQLRGPALFGLGAGLAGEELTAPQRGAAIAWALIDAGRLARSAAALALARDQFAHLPRSATIMPLRPLTLLASLARSDAKRGLEGASDYGSPTRMARALLYFLADQ